MEPSRIQRLLRLITLLQSGAGHSASELTRQLGISRRTLFRDLRMLQSAGIPYYHEPGVGYRIQRHFFLPPAHLTVTETLGLMMLGKTASATRERPLVMPALSAIYKLLSTVPEPIRSACSELMSRVSVDPGARSLGGDEADRYALLQRAADEGRVCLVRYKSPVEAASFTCRFHPYALHFANRAWYAFGHTDRHGEVRLLKLSRIEHAELLDQTFRRPEGFSIERKLGKAWQLIPEGVEHEVELEFSPKVGQNVSEVRWHPTQSQHLLADGRCRMSFTVDGLNEIAWWLCGYADQVQILKPALLRERVGQMLERAVLLHRGQAAAWSERPGN